MSRRALLTNPWFQGFVTWLAIIVAFFLADLLVGSESAGKAALFTLPIAVGLGIIEVIRARERRLPWWGFLAGIGAALVIGLLVL